ncbi:MAG: hypothetical protein E6G55_12545, partial [Actinobacteria bacterium]
MDPDARSQRLGKILIPGEEALGLLDPTLEHPELGQLGRRMDTARPMTGPSQGAERLDEAPLRRLEIPLRLEELRPARAAEGDQRSVEVPGHVGLDHVVPSHQSLEFARLLAGQCDDTADVAEYQRVGHLAGRGRDHRLVEGRDPPVELAAQQERSSEERECRCLQFRVFGPTGGLKGRLCVGPHLVRVEGAAAPCELEPSVGRAGLDVAQQALRTREPSVAGRLIADRLHVFPGQPKRDPRGPDRVTSLAEGRVRA